MVEVLELRVQGLGFKASDLSTSLKNSPAWGSLLKAEGRLEHNSQSRQDSGTGFQGKVLIFFSNSYSLARQRSRVQGCGFGFRVLGFGLRVPGLRLRVWG